MRKQYIQKQEAKREPRLNRKLQVVYSYQSVVLVSDGGKSSSSEVGGRQRVGWDIRKKLGDEEWNDKGSLEALDDLHTL